MHSLFLYVKYSSKILQVAFLEKFETNNIKYIRVLYGKINKDYEWHSNDHAFEKHCCLLPSFPIFNLHSNLNRVHEKHFMFLLRFCFWCFLSQNKMHFKTLSTSIF